MRKALYFVAVALVAKFALSVRTESSGKPPSKISAGVVVESIEKGGVAEKAGILVGDVLLSWERAGNPPANPEPARGSIGTIFDWNLMVLEQAPRGAVKLHGERDGKPMEAALAVGRWGLEARPVMEKPALAKFLEGRALLEAKELERGLGLWENLAIELNVAGRWDQACWLYLKMGRLRGKEGKQEEALEAFAKARSSAQANQNDQALAEAWTTQGDAFKAKNDFAKAEEAYQAALAIREKSSPGSLALAASLSSLGVSELERGDLAGAQAHFERVLAVQEKLAPESLDLAASLNGLGILAWRRGNLDGAEASHRRALAIKEKLAPNSQSMAASLKNLGLVARERGDLAKAEDFLGRALAIEEELAPESLNVAMSLNNLGIVASYRGDIAGAETYFKRALALKEKLAPESLEVARSSNNLGEVARRRGDLAGAEVYFKRALAIKEKLAPDSLEVASSLNNLGALAWGQGDLAGLEAYSKRALTIKEKLAPESLNVALTLYNFGRTARERGHIAEADAFFRRALAIQEKLAPEGLDVAMSLTSLAYLARDNGDSAKAENLFSRALAIREKLAPGSQEEAESLHDLGVLHRDKKDTQGALGFLLRAVSALEAQRGKLGGGKEASERFSASFADYYRDLVELQTHLREKTDAFNTLERFRARSLLDMLAERDLDFAKDAPEDLIREQKRAAFQYDKVQKQLAEVNPVEEAKKVESLLAKLRELKEQQRTIGEKIKAASPKLASLQYPNPLDLAGTRAVLPPSTLLLSFCAGERHLSLFALLDGKLEIYMAPVAREELQKKVRSYRQLLSDSSSDKKELNRQGRELYAILLKPAQKEIQKAQALLICPDGPLHYLPFAALKVDKKRYLAEEKPLAYAVSATVYAELSKGSVGKGTPVPLVAFGDPTYPGKERAEGLDGALRAATRISDLSPLPNTRREVEGLKALYKDAGIFLGERATEEEAKNLGKEAPLIHFACHGIVDERFPLDSALALTIPEKAEEGKENGLLQAWEIFEKLRIDADLVTLSACETGLGKEMGGEGLIGLTRAFQYAGARSVLSSLWSVSDESTAELMKRFYGYLKAGKPKAEALRLAQVYLIHNTLATEAAPTSERQALPPHESNSVVRTPSSAPGQVGAPAPRIKLRGADVLVRAWAGGGLSAARQAPAPRELAPAGTPPSPGVIHPSSIILHQQDYSHPFYWAGFVLNGDPR